MVATLTQLISMLKERHRSDDIRSIKRAYFIAKKLYLGQIRQTGEPLIKHPLAVAITLADWGLDKTSIIAGLLHELPDMNSNYLEILSQKFKNNVDKLVEGVHRVGKVKLRGSQDHIFLENLRKMFVAMAQDIRVVLIRLADRLHNIQTLDAVPLSKQKRIAVETLEIYAPLAERLGMGKLKGDLEDLAFPYLYPDEYFWLMEVAKPHFKYSEENTHDIIIKIRQILAKRDIRAKTDGRPKRKYSLYRKLLRPEVNRDISQIHDLMAVRIITQDESTCYSVLGLMHQYWKPVPYLGISDFIAQPKPNGYRSIHTKVFDHKGNIIEIQIRSEEMHIQAEYGAAAHFAYSQAKNSGVSSDKLQKGTAFKLDEKINWVKDLSDWKFQIETMHESSKELKSETLSSHIYVFSPKGDVFDLPENSTPVDFAFAVHTNLGLYINSVKVNNKIASIDHILKSGDVVEILKSKSKKAPSRNWLRFVKTHQAKAKIRKYNS